jgi:uncharacterized protein
MWSQNTKSFNPFFLKLSNPPSLPDNAVPDRCLENYINPALPQSLSSKMYDTAIIGAGPAGLFAAERLARSGLKVIIIDKGKDILKRSCKIGLTRLGCVKCSPCDIMAGVGGAGAFSDGKLNLTPDIGMFLEEIGITREEAEKRIKEVDELLLKCGVKDELYGKSKRVEEWVKRTEKVNLFVKSNFQRGMVKLVPALQRHIGSDSTPKVINTLKQHILRLGAEFRLSFNVQEILKNTHFYIKSGTEIIQAKTLIVAPGRGGAYWFRDQARKLGLKTRFGPIDVGIRVELLAKDMDEITRVIYDPKFWINTPSYDDRVRTFCTNPRGFVTMEQVDGSLLVNGHAMRNKKSRNTNFALLCTVNLTEPVVDTTMYGKNAAHFCNFIADDQVILQRLGDLKRGRRTHNSYLKDNEVKPSLSAYCCGDLGLAMGYRIINNLKESLELLNMVIPGISKDSTLLYAPEVKYYDTRYDTKGLQTSIKGLYVAGDGCGKSRGIIGAAMTGIIAAENLLEHA